MDAGGGREKVRKVQRHRRSSEARGLLTAGSEWSSVVLSHLAAVKGGPLGGRSLLYLFSF